MNWKRWYLVAPGCGLLVLGCCLFVPIEGNPLSYRSVFSSGNSSGTSVVGGVAAAAEAPVVQESNPVEVNAGLGGARASGALPGESATRPQELIDAHQRELEDAGILQKQKHLDAVARAYAQALALSGEAGGRLPSMRGLVAQRYARFFELAKLTPEETQAVTEILTAEMAARRKMVGSPGYLTQPVGYRITQGEVFRDDTIVRLTQVLSTESLEYYDTYRASLARRDLVTDISAVMALQGQGMSPGVIDSVTQILHDHRISPGSLSSQITVTQAQYEMFVQRDEKVYAAVSKLMSPEQFKQFKLSLAARYRVRR